MRRRSGRIRRAAPFAFAAGIATALVAQARPAFADPCPVEDPHLAALAGVDAEDRLRFLASAFDRDVRNIDIWSWTWGSVYAGGTVAQIAIIPVVKDGVRTDLSVGAVSAGVGALSLYVLPLQITLPLRSVRGRWREPDRCKLLAEAEAALVTGARHEAISNGPLGHIGNVLANVGIGLVLGLGYGRWQSAWISAVTGIAIGEANAFTQPHSLGRALIRYRTGQLDESLPRRASVSWGFAPLRVQGAWGMAFGVSGL